MNLLFEFFPLILFLVAFFYKGIYFALVVLMIAMPVGLAVKYLRTKTLDKMYLGSTIFLLVAGALTLYFRDPVFLFWKPTAFYWVVAIAVLGSQSIGEMPLAKRFFRMVDELPVDKITAVQWNRLNIIWVLFLVGAGILNIVVAYNFEIETWVKFKVFGLMAITFVFLIAQTFWISRLIGDDAVAEHTEQD